MNVSKLCKNVSPEMKREIRILAKAVKALGDKVEEQLPVYNDLPLAQLLTTTQGEKALKANPAAQEFRATVRDYAQALNSLQDIVNKCSDPEAKHEKDRAAIIVGNSRWKMNRAANDRPHFEHEQIQIAK